MKKPDPYLLDDDAPEITEAWLDKALPTRTVLAEVWGEEKADAFLAENKRYIGQRGKQKAPTKQRITISLDPDILDAFKRGGSGWQTRINDALRQVMPPSAY